MSFVSPYDYGAAGDGHTNDTRAVQMALDAAAESGKRCLLPYGCFVCGTLRLKSNTWLEIGAGAVLKASPDIQDYAEDTHYNRYRNEPEL
ncbi:MAG: glycosyl hydrolase family 28-related protein, partial [Faecalibacterium sp.]